LKSISFFLICCFFLIGKQGVLKAEDNLIGAGASFPLHYAPLSATAKEKSLSIIQSVTFDGKKF